MVLCALHARNFNASHNLLTGSCSWTTGLFDVSFNCIMVDACSASCQPPSCVLEPQFDASVCQENTSSSATPSSTPSASLTATRSVSQTTSPSPSPSASESRSARPLLSESPSHSASISCSHSVSMSASGWGSVTSSTRYAWLDLQHCLELGYLSTCGCARACPAARRLHDRNRTCGASTCLCACFL
jgi:hypothetical protein